LYALYRAGKGNVAAPPGTSDHEHDQAIDVRIGSGITLSRILAALAGKGIRARGFLENDHYHVSWAQRSRARGGGGTTVHIQTVPVHGAKDATAAARGFGKALSKEGLVIQSNSGLQS
jgi:hypothetical protein